MSRMQNNLGRGLSDLIGEVSQVRAVPTRAAPAPSPAPAPVAPPPARRPANTRPLVIGLGLALGLSLLACGVLAWRVAHPAPVEPVVIRVPVPAPSPVFPPAPPPPPRDTRLDWAGGLALAGVKVEATEQRVRLVFEQPVFQSRDQLRPGADALLRQVAAAFQPHAGECQLVVAGHTDDDAPRPGGPYRDNVSLGYLRALAAADVLRAAGLPPAALRVTSAGAQGAPYPNTDAAGKQRNRTVTLLIERR